MISIKNILTMYVHSFQMPSDMCVSISFVKICNKYASASFYISIIMSHSIVEYLYKVLTTDK